MSRRGNNILKNIVSISEEFSGTSCEEDENEITQNKDEIEILESDEIGQTGESSDSEKENLQNLCRSRKRMRILSDSESENETNIPRSSQNLDAVCDTEIAIDGIIWTKLKVGGSSGRPPVHRIFKDIAGPTGYSKRNVMEGNVSSAFHLIIIKNMIEHIKCCTEAEACRVLKSDWNISTTKLLAFVAILYARGAYEAKSLNAFYLCSKKWGPGFFFEHNAQRSIYANSSIRTI